MNGSNLYKDLLKADDEKPASTAKNRFKDLSDSERLGIARLLARAGDYSEFEIFTQHIASEKLVYRLDVVFGLKEFRRPKDPITVSATDLLVFAAKTDPSIFIRESAIRSLNKIVKTNPELKPKLTEAIAANINSSDRSLRSNCKALKNPHPTRPTIKRTKPKKTD